MLHSGNMDGHGIVTEVESARLTDIRGGPDVLDTSGCTGEHCDGPGCVVDTSVGVIDIGDRPDGSCSVLSRGGDSRVSASDRSDGVCHVESGGDSGPVSETLEIREKVSESERKEKKRVLSTSLCCQP